MTIATENTRAMPTCRSFRDSVRELSDRMVVVDPGNPPYPGFSDRFTGEIRRGIVGPLHARVPNPANRGIVQVMVDDHDIEASMGLERLPDMNVAYLNVEVANLLKVTTTAARVLRDEEQVHFGADHHGFPGTFDLWVEIEADSNARMLLPGPFIERYDSGMAATGYTFKAAAQHLGDGVYEMWLLLGGRGGSPEVELPEQYLLGRGEQGTAYAWPVYTVHRGALDVVAPQVRVGEIYHVRHGEPSLVLEQMDDGTYHVVSLERPEPLYRAVRGYDLTPLTEEERARSGVWWQAAIAVAVRERRIYREAERRASAAADRAREERERHRADIARISDALIEQADRRGWCSDYDDFVETLNEDLHVPLEVRTKEFEVEARVVFYTRVTVEARDAEEAESKVNDDNSIVLDELDTYDPDSISVTSVTEE